MGRFGSGASWGCMPESGSVMENADVAVRDSRFTNTRLPQRDRNRDLCHTRLRLLEVRAIDGNRQATPRASPMTADFYFFGFRFPGGLLSIVFLAGRPSFGCATNVSTSDRSTRILPATLTLVSRPRLTRSAIACLDTPRIRAAST